MIAFAGHVYKFSYESVLFLSEVQAATQSKCVRLQWIPFHLIIYNSRLHSQTQVFGYIKLRQRRIHIRIDHLQCIDCHDTEEAQVSPSAETVLPVLEDSLVTFYVRVVDFGSEVQELVVALRVGVVVHEVEIGL